MVDYAAKLQKIIQLFAPGTTPLTLVKTGNTMIAQADEAHVSIVDILPTEISDTKRRILVIAEVEVSSLLAATVPLLQQEIIDAVDRYSAFGSNHIFVEVATGQNNVVGVNLDNGNTFNNDPADEAVNPAIQVGPIYYQGFLRVATPIAIPIGTSIVGAELWLYNTSGALSGDFIINGLKTTSVPAITTHEALTALTHTTATKTMELADWVAGWNNVDVTTIVEEIIASGQLDTAGNYTGFRLKPDTGISSSCIIRARNDANSYPGLYPTLRIKFENPVSTPNRIQWTRGSGTRPNGTRWGGAVIVNMLYDDVTKVTT